MEMSRRAKRMERNHKMRKQPALNLVSLMDIFTILVFFLLATSSNSYQLPKSKDLKLPSSVAKKAPKETLIIMVTNNYILVQGRKIVMLNQVRSNNAKEIPSLEKELDFLSGKRLIKDDNEKKKGYSVTIMGDEQLPYELLSKILATCRKANYTQIAFAAIQKAKS